MPRAFRAAGLFIALAIGSAAPAQHGFPDAPGEHYAYTATAWMAKDSRSAMYAMALKANAKAHGAAIPLALFSKQDPKIIWLVSDGGRGLGGYVARYREAKGSMKLEWQRELRKRLPNAGFFTSTMERLLMRRGLMPKERLPNENDPSLDKINSVRPYVAYQRDRLKGSLTMWYVPASQGVFLSKIVKRWTGVLPYHPYEAPGADPVHRIEAARAELMELALRIDSSGLHDAGGYTRFMFPFGRADILFVQCDEGSDESGGLYWLTCLRRDEHEGAVVVWQRQLSKGRLTYGRGTLAIFLRTRGFAPLPDSNGNARTFRWHMDFVSGFSTYGWGHGEGGGPSRGVLDKSGVESFDSQHYPEDTEDYLLSRLEMKDYILTRAEMDFLVKNGSIR